MRFKIFEYNYEHPHWPDKYPYSDKLYCSIKAAQKALGVVRQDNTPRVLTSMGEFYIRKVS